MSARWSRLVAALVIMAAVLVAGSTSASGAPAQDHPAVGENVGYQPVGAYDAVLPEAVPVVGSDTAGAVAATAHMAAAHVYDGPVVSRAGANVSIPAENPFYRVIAGEGGSTSLVAEAVGTSTTSARSLVTPSSGGQRIYRAVEPDELTDLLGSGQYRNIPGIGGGKYFFPTRQQADAFAEMMTKRGMGGPYCTTSGCIPADVLRQVERISPAGEGVAYYIPDSLLPYIDDILIHGG